MSGSLVGRDALLNNIVWSVRKNWGMKLDAAAHGAGANGGSIAAGHPMDGVDSHSLQHHHQHESASPSAISLDGHSDKDAAGHVPHLLCKPLPIPAPRHPLLLTSFRPDQTQSLRRASFASSHGSVPSLTNSLSPNSSTSSSYPHKLSSAGPPSYELPAFIKPTPTRIPAEDLEYLLRKGALTLPEEPLRSTLLNAHFDIVHPYMPLLDRKQFLEIVDTEDGSKGRVGLLLFQAVMFSGSAVSRPRAPASRPLAASPPSLTVSPRPHSSSRWKNCGPRDTPPGKRRERPSSPGRGCSTTSITSRTACSSCRRSC